jgi:hypothetical protein
MSNTSQVLVIHALRPTSRQTTIDHLLSFREHLSDADVQYLHFGQPLPKEIEDSLRPDLTIVNYDFLNYRFSPLWPYIKNRFRQIALRSGSVVAIPQDDFWGYRLLDDWCMSWKADRILTPIDNDLDVLYPRASKHAEFRTVLTGYAPRSVPPEIPFDDREIDLGQRVRTMPAHLGAFAQEKSDQAINFASHARSFGYLVDVSANVEESLLGDKWLEFLGNCRFTVGMKGGASIPDPYGHLYVRTESRRRTHPGASMRAEEIPWLRRRDGRYRFAAISPRLLEAAATKTCQVLRHDNYLDILTPWEDYLPLNTDFGNVKEVLSAMRDKPRCAEVANNAYHKLIASGHYTSRHLVGAATELLLKDAKRDHDSSWRDLKVFNELMGAAVNFGHTDLHDAVLHLIHESLSGLSRPNAIAVEVVRDRLVQHNLLDWYQVVHHWSTSDHVFTRSPWIWRPVPTPEERTAIVP